MLMMMTQVVSAVQFVDKKKNCFNDDNKVLLFVYNDVVTNVL